MATTVTASLDLRTLAQAVRLKLPDAGEALDRIQNAFNLLDARLGAITTRSVTGVTTVDIGALPVIPGSSVSLPLFYLTGAAFTDHSPTSGAVAWTGAHVTYKGIPYSVADGSTASTYIVWSVLSPNVFTGAASSPTLNTSFLVGVNRAGAFSFVWDKPQVDGLQIQDQTITAAQVANATITATQIANATITASQIANATITATQISGTAGITGSQIAAATIAASNIVLATITASQIANATITTTQISGMAGITGGQIASATITATNIANATITASQIANVTITASQIANLTITGSQIADATITSAKIYDLVVSKITSWDGANISVGAGFIFTGAHWEVNINDSGLLINYHYAGISMSNQLGPGSISVTHSTPSSAFIECTGHIKAGSYLYGSSLQINSPTLTGVGINSFGEAHFDSLTLTTPLAVAQGGTGATTVPYYTQAETNSAIAAAVSSALTGLTAQSAGTHDHVGAVTADGNHTHSVS